MNKLKKQLENISDEDEKTQSSTDQQQDCELKSKFSDYDNCETSPEDQIILNKLKVDCFEVLYYVYAIKKYKNTGVGFNGKVLRRTRCALNGCKGAR